MTHLEKTSQLRQLMQQEKIDAFFVPHADEFQNEYTSPYAERLSFISGFDGSAGCAIITQNDAVLFVDGRYILQAPQQIDQSIWGHFLVSQKTPHQWLKDQKDTLKTMGIDPWLHTKNEIESFQKILNLKSLAANPIDRIWDNQPAKPKQLLFEHHINFAGKTSAEKRQLILSQINSCDKLLITTCDAISWLLNIRAQHLECTPTPLCYAALDKNGDVDLFVDQDCLSDDIKLFFSQKNQRVITHDFEKINSFLNDFNGTIFYDPNEIPFALFERIKEKKAFPITNPCKQAKAIKNVFEQNHLRQTHIFDGLALSVFLYAMKTKKGHAHDEISAASFLDELRSNLPHFFSLSFPVIAGSGPNGAIVHYRATQKSNRNFKQDDMLLIDSGGQYFGGTTDVTRTIILGTATPPQKKHFTLVLKGHIALANACFPKGTSGSQLDILARQFLWQEELDYNHGTGHGVGYFLNVHEGPQSISPRPNATALHEGMVVSNEPGFYLTDNYGIRIENLILVVAKNNFLCFETLTLAPIDHDLIDTKTLTQDEKNWLNTYHQKTFDALENAIDVLTKENHKFLDHLRNKNIDTNDFLLWLKSATKTIS